MALNIESKKAKLINRRKELEQLIRASEGKVESVKKSVSASEPKIYGIVGCLIGFSAGLLALSAINSSIYHYYPNTTLEEQSGESYKRLAIEKGTLACGFVYLSSCAGMLADTLFQVITSKVAYKRLASDYELILKHYKELNEVQAKLYAIEEKSHAKPLAFISISPEVSLETSATAQSRASYGLS